MNPRVNVHLDRKTTFPTRLEAMTIGMLEPNSYAHLCIHRLRGQGMRITKTRRIAAQAIEQVGTSFTAKSLHEFVAEKFDAQFDFATLFRIIQTFESLGLIHPDSRSGWYLACQHLTCGDFVHVIFSCVECAKTFEEHLPKKIAREVTTAVGKLDEFHAISSVLQIRGRCAPCHARSLN